MTIDLVTRVAYPHLYTRMGASAALKAANPVNFISEPSDGHIRPVQTYNRLGAQSNADIIIFCHDDAVFHEQEWDEKLAQEFAETGADILGVVGADKYAGGLTFSAGPEHCFGKYAPNEQTIKVASPALKDKRLATVDGFFMAVRGDHFKAHKFDDKLDGEWYYAEDYCLGGKVFLSDILMGHNKPDELYGKYPEGMKGRQAYDGYFRTKWGFKDVPADRGLVCAVVPVMTFFTIGQDAAFEEFKRRYAEAKA